MCEDDLDSNKLKSNSTELSLNSNGLSGNFACPTNIFKYKIYSSNRIHLSVKSVIFYAQVIQVLTPFRRKENDNKEKSLYQL
jgi:hypothetical protein